MINYLSKFNYLSIKLITCQNKLIADQKMIDDYTKTVHLQLLVQLVRINSKVIYSAASASGDFCLTGAI